MTTLKEQAIDEAQESVLGFDEEAFNRLDTSQEPSLLKAKREQAFHAYLQTKCPSPADEEWRRTDPSLFPFGELSQLPFIFPARQTSFSPWDEFFDVVVSIRDNSYSIKDCSGVLEQGRVAVLPLTDASTHHPELVKRCFGGALGSSRSGKYELLNDAFWNVGFFVYVPEGVHLEKGILLHYEYERPRSIAVPKLVVLAERGSYLKLAERLTTDDQTVFMSMSSKDVYVEESAHVEVVSLQTWGCESFYWAHDMARVARDAKVDWVTLNLGSKVSKVKLGSDVAGAGARAELDGLFFCTGEQHIDQTTLQIHSSPDTYSRLLYKGAVKDRSHSVYQGLIRANPGAVNVDAYQTNNNLVLSNGARADTIPGLLIDADDLKCSHGATIGNLDPSQLFYLRTRGLSEREARQILIRGFYEEVTSRITFDHMRDEVEGALDVRAASHEQS